MRLVKVEVRKVSTGEMLFRDSISGAVVAIVSADLRNAGMHDVVVCSVRGGVKGFNASSCLPPSAQTLQNITAKENTLARLNQKHKAMMDKEGI